jgi:hypothetical protein
MAPKASYPLRKLTLPQGGAYGSEDSVSVVGKDSMDDELAKPSTKVTPGKGKQVPGPTLPAGGQAGPLPCGCRVAPDPDSKMRYWFCNPHAVAYEMLEVLKEAEGVINQIVAASPNGFDTTGAMEIGMKARKVLKKARGDWK